jgi:hypothetical protein
MMVEIWKDIPGYDDVYQVSNCGKVKILHYRANGRERIKKCGYAKGYEMVSLHKDGKVKGYQIHQLVAMAFLGHKPDGLNIVVNHIDNNKLNNRLDNLELVSVRYNSSCHKIDPGICWHKQMNKWTVKININKHQVYLGYFIEKEIALEQYKKALDNMHLYNGDAKAFRNALKQL